MYDWMMLNNGKGWEASTVRPLPISLPTLANVCSLLSQAPTSSQPPTSPATTLVVTTAPPASPATVIARGSAPSATLNAPPPPPPPKEASPLPPPLSSATVRKPDGTLLALPSRAPTRPRWRSRASLLPASGGRHSQIGRASCRERVS